MGAYHTLFVYRSECYLIDKPRPVSHASGKLRNPKGKADHD